MPAPLHFLLFAALLLTAAVPYYFALDNPFTDDDWVFLYHYRDRSFLGLFGPRVIWFWRPLHCAMFAGLWRVAGLNPVPYNLAGLGLFFVGAGLWYALFARLLRRTGPALLALAFLLVSWQYCDAVFWKSNYGTLLAWIGTAWVLIVASCPLPVAGSDAWRGQNHAAAAFVFALLAKESAVNIPLLAAVVWAYQWRAELAAAPRAALRQGARRLGPLFAILAAYLVFHHYCVVDIEAVNQAGYALVGPLTAGRQYLLAMNHLIFFFDYGPFPPGLNGIFNFIETRLLFIPLALWGWALWRRDGPLLLALALATAGLLPTVLLQNYHSSRFYLLPAGGMALAWAILTWRALAALENQDRPKAVQRTWVKPARIALVILIALAALRSWMQLDGVVQYDRANCQIVKRYQDFIIAHRAELPPDACLVLKMDRRLSGGFGLREMAKMLLGSERAEAFREGDRLDAKYAARLNAHYPNKYRLWMDERGRVNLQPLGNAQLRK